jgi:hypothetical protein
VVPCSWPTIVLGRLCISILLLSRKYIWNFFTSVPTIDRFCPSTDVADKIVPEDNILTTAQVSLKLYQQMEDEQFKQKLRQVFTDV